MTTVNKKKFLILEKENGRNQIDMKTKNNERQTLFNTLVFICYLIDHIHATYKRTSVNANY